MDHICFYLVLLMFINWVKANIGWTETQKCVSC